jgi:hypothetical protein
MLVLQRLEARSSKWFSMIIFPKPVLFLNHGFHNLILNGLSRSKPSSSTNLVLA